jgi:SAM-dependent methyltransferase
LNGQIDPVAEAVSQLSSKTNTMMNDRGLFSIHPSPDFASLPYLRYRVTPAYSNWSGVTLVPVFDPNLRFGSLGIELVTLDRKIIYNATKPLTQIEPFKPVSFKFPSIPDSRSKTYDLRVFSRDTRSPISILERGIQAPAARWHFLLARPLVKLAFNDTVLDSQAEKDLASSQWQTPLTLEMAALVGSQSLEDHYWCSGWQTANLQLVADLKINESIIDIGCGVGRLAHGLHGWFGGRYVGTDIMQKAIDYCKKAFPRFEFYHLDLKSPYYNPNGVMDGTEMVLPTADQSFDVAVLYSVYTHLLPPSFARMTCEVSRVLKQNGRCLASFLILDQKTDRSIFSFSHPISDDCRVEWKDSPESAVGYRKDFIVNNFLQNGLRVEKYYTGSWTGQEGITVQDQILFVKD